MGSLDPKKSLGQHFFTNKNLSEQIVTYVLESDPHTVLEIGPGTGVFTHLLNEKIQNVIAIEIDYEKFELLSHLSHLQDVNFINADLLELDKESFQALINDPNKSVVFGSLPYNSSKKIIAHMLLETEVRYFYYIIQKEVAEKYMGKGVSNRLSIQISAFADVRLLKNISPSNFFPKPKVESSFIRIYRRDEPLIPLSEYASFATFLNKAFSKPRKKLLNNLKNSLSEELIVRNKDLLEKRPGELSVEMFVKLYKEIDSRNLSSDIIPPDEERE